jgi:hypothetical protein
MAVLDFLKISLIWAKISLIWAKIAITRQTPDRGPDAELFLPVIEARTPHGEKSFV